MTPQMQGFCPVFAFFLALIISYFCVFCYIISEFSFIQYTLIKSKLGNTAEVLYLISNPKKPEKAFEAAKFDVNHFKMLPYRNDGNGVDELKKGLESELKAFYCI